MRKSHPLYGTWMTMLHRCENSSRKGYARYGGRGITVCAAWSNRVTGFDRFVSDMGPKPSPRHTLDREDNDRDYEPGNCRWATRTEQARNTSRNVLVSTPRGVEVAVEAARANGVHPNTIYSRLRRGIPIDGGANRKPRAKLTIDSVRAIRALIVGGSSSTQIAARFGVSAAAIRSIRAGRAWSDAT